MEHGGVDQEMTLFHIKRTRGTGKIGPWKKSKVRKTSFDLITLIEKDLNNIGDMVRDATAKLLQQFDQWQ